MSPIGKGLEAYLHRQVTEIALNQLAEAREQAANIKERALVELEQQRQQLSKGNEREQREERQRILAKAKLEVLGHSVTTREQFLQQVWQRVEKELRTFNSTSPKSRVGVLEALIMDAADQLEGGDLVIQVAQFDGDLAVQALKEIEANLKAKWQESALHLNPEPADIWGGVLVFRRDSNLMVDNSFDTRFGLVKRSLRDQVIELLEAGQADGSDVK
ncbi:MAG: V-type ATP synthase subunit E [Anaerolineae bacterium]